MVDNVSFDVRAGEILGIAGIAGNGQSELLEAIAGIRKPASGEIFIDGQPVAALEGACRSDLGLAHIPEDRHRMGLVLLFEEYEKSIISYKREQQDGRGACVNLDAIRKVAANKKERQREEKG